MKTTLVTWLLVSMAIVCCAARNHTISKYCPTISEVTIAVMHSPPYVLCNSTSHDGHRNESTVRGVMVDYFISSIKMCYSTCPPFNIRWKVVDTPQQLIECITTHKCNIAMPITSALELNLTWPDYTGKPLVFFKIVKAERRALIVEKNYFNHKCKTLMLQALVDTWPIFAYTFLLAGLSGIVIWFLESRVNSVEFEQNFTKGCYEGFWWAFVSMTTVGYGDKTPKSISGRVYGMIWILVGLFIIAMFTATATAALTQINSGIHNKKVAVLSSTDASLHAANSGAIPQEFESFAKMFKALKDVEVDGIFIDQYVGAYYMNAIDDKRLRVLTSSDTSITYMMVFTHETSHAMKIYNSDCFENIYEHPSPDHLLNKYSTTFKTFDYSEDFTGLFSSKAEYTETILYVLLVLLVVAWTIGILTELIQHKYPQCSFRRSHGNFSCNSKKQKSHLNTAHNNMSLDADTSTFRSANLNKLDELRAADASLKMLSDEIQRLRVTISSIMEPAQLNN